MRTVRGSPGITGDVKRAGRIVVAGELPGSGQKVTLTTDAFEARALQHEIDHCNGYRTRYAHNLANVVQVGDPIRSGQLIARMGSTGRSTGNHVHFEVWKDGRLVNPSTYIRAIR